MDQFEYKVLKPREVGVFKVHWFDGNLDLGPEISAELLNPYGMDGWEVIAIHESQRILLKRCLADEQRINKLRVVRELVGELADEQ